MSEHESRPGARAAALITVPVAIASLGLGAMILSGMEGTARSVLAVLLVLGGGVGLGPLMLATPVEPSPLKLWLFSSLLGLPLVGGTFARAKVPPSNQSFNSSHCRRVAVIKVRVKFIWS